MNSDLCKKLKDNGFPQLLNDNLDLKNNRTHEKTIYKPTLSELIKACGGSWFKMYGQDDEWGAESENGDIVVRGKTPEESVAKLWLALNKKSP